MHIEVLTVPAVHDKLNDLAELLQDAVDSGASGEAHAHAHSDLER